MKNIVLFGAGKSATCLIDYLSQTCLAHQWTLYVADTNPETLNDKLAGLPSVYPVQVNVENTVERNSLIEKADLVISLLPPLLHILIARSCLTKSKNLLTASYIDEKIRLLQSEIEDKGLLFLYEMGLDPGIDHMSAMRLIDRIRSEGGKISSFRSHTGGLVAPESDDNPWHYKISWNPRNVVRAGSAGAIFKEHHQICQITYQHLFENTGTVTDEQSGTYSFYPNRDSLGYIPIYGLQEAETFVRTTLRHPDFCRGWKDIVAAGLTDDQKPISSSVKTIAEWSASLRTYINAFNKPLFDFLGFFEHNPLPAGASTSADVLQFLIEIKWKMQDQDKDLIIMLHELAYSINQKKYALKSSLLVKGENKLRTAMAKTVGLPLGITARLILENKIKLRGLLIPIIPEIYQPVLKELEIRGIRFHDTVS
jgi:saccharopine dehydrogenase (NADP+, L-glutamate forming)